MCSPLAPAMAIHLSTYILIEKFARLDALIAEKCYDCMCVCVCVSRWLNVCMYVSVSCRSVANLLVIRQYRYFKCFAYLNFKHAHLDFAQSFTIIITAII